MSTVITINESVTDINISDGAQPTTSYTSIVISNEQGAQGPTGPAGIVNNSTLAMEPELLITGSITRNSSGVVTSAAVVWSDGTTGTYTSLTFDSATGAVNSYQITKGSAIYTQPTLTRNSAGAVTNRPAIVVT
jgi:hypothetical protein